MSSKNEIGALLLRVTLGLVFLAHGAAKFQGQENQNLLAKSA